MYQAGVCSSGSLNGVFSRSLYKVCFVHGIASESLERLLLERFVREVIENIVCMSLFKLHVLPGGVHPPILDMPLIFLILRNTDEKVVRQRQ